MRLIRLGLTLPTQAPPEMIDIWTCRCGRVHISLHWMKPVTNVEIWCSHCKDHIRIHTTPEASYTTPSQLIAVTKEEA